MDQQKTLFDDFLSRIKNNRILASLLVIGTIIIAVSAFTDAAQKIVHFMAKDQTQNIAGEWQTQALTNPYAESQQYKLLFEFIQQGGSLSGTVTDMDIDEANRSGKSITDGKIEGNMISFYTQGTLDLGETLQPYKETYLGTLNKTKDEVAFKRINDYGGKTETFAAKRK